MTCSTAEANVVLFLLIFYFYLYLLFVIVFSYLFQIFLTIIVPFLIHSMILCCISQHVCVLNYVTIKFIE